MSNQRPTRLQKQLLSQIQEITEILALDPNQILVEWSGEPEAVTTHLRRIIDHLIRGEILTQYTLVDSMLNFRLGELVFGRGRSLRKVQGKAKHRALTEICEHIYPMEKVKVIQQHRKMPKRYVSTMAALNDLRNGLAHSFFIEDLPKAKKTFLGNDVFTPDGLSEFQKAMGALFDYLV
jgi:hypothetical protein